MSIDPDQPSRRRFIALAGGAALATCPLCRPVLAQSHGMMSPHAVGPHWKYDGEEGPSHWAEISPDFENCRFGAGQSPIDLDHPIMAVRLEGVETSWRPVPTFIENNGHTIQLSVPPGSSTTIAGKRYTLRQFHFHHPSEHTISGDHFPMELHFVHATDAGEVAVLAVLLAAGPANAAFGKIVEMMPRQPGRARHGTQIDPAALLPETRHFFRYVGSLTTPPCSEPVLWTVFSKPVTISEAQLGAFAGLFPSNARPLQPLNARHLLLR